jgi:hypothetical protein
VVEQEKKTKLANRARVAHLKSLFIDDSPFPLRKSQVCLVIENSSPLNQVRVQWLYRETCPVVLEYWSLGVLERTRSQESMINIFYITLLLHHSITPDDSLTELRL